MNSRLVPLGEQNGRNIMTSKRNIKVVIFDMFGVIIRTETQEPRMRLAARMGISVEELCHLVIDTEESRLAQIGILSTEERWERLAKRLGLDPARADELRHEMFAGDKLDDKMVAYIHQLRARVNTALRSNATPRLAQRLQELHIEDCFDEVIISAQVGLAKPDPAIYKLAMDRLRVEPAEVVFIDDTPENVSSAAALGIHAILFTTRQALMLEMEPFIPEFCNEAVLKRS
jgi:putative hydrolase of the HAD superfamily